MSRKKVLLGGFWGRGNCGDEAMLQCQYEFFSTRYDVGILVDQYGAYDKFWEWYPYNLCLPLFHQASIDHFYNQDIALLHCGGGGLSVGFLANQVFKSVQYEIPTVLSGIDLWGDDLKGNTAVSSYVNLFDCVMYRDVGGLPQSYSFLSSMENVSQGSDWAFGLLTDEYPAIVHDARRALFVIRELPLNLVTNDYIGLIAFHIEMVKLAGLTPVFLPFSPEDVSFLDRVGLAHLAVTIDLWNNPRRMQQYIMNSGMVVSYGRLHPLIFSANVGTPAALISNKYLLNHEYEDAKTSSMARGLGIPILSNKQEFSDFLKYPTAPSPTKVQQARRYLSEMQDQILGAIER